MSEEERAAAYRVQQRVRLHNDMAIVRGRHGSAAAYLGLYERTKALKGPFDYGDQRIYELEDPGGPVGRDIQETL